jgi:hypothetical protein
VRKRKSVKFFLFNDEQWIESHPLRHNKRFKFKDIQTARFDANLIRVLPGRFSITTCANSRLNSRIVLLGLEMPTRLRDVFT